MNVFFFNDTATTEIYTLSLHDALPIWPTRPWSPNHPKGSPRSATPGASTATPNGLPVERWLPRRPRRDQPAASDRRRSEEHTSELQSRQYLVCRLLLEKKKNIQ